jgi:RNA polymerase-binding transcription factor DksA
MVDEADIANDYIDNEVSRALVKIRQNAPAKSGSKTCTECGEDIPEARRMLGFQLCVACATETERRKSMFANY